jgi:hypothetical protein
VAATGDRDREQIRIVSDDGEEVTVTLAEGPRLVIVHDDEEGVIDIDLAEFGEIMGEALAGVGEAMAALTEAQIELQFGRDDNSLTLFADGDETFYLDLGLVMEEIGDVVEEALAEFEDFDWDRDFTWHREDDRRVSRHVERHDDGEAALEEEIETLRTELESLRSELRRLRRRSRH